MKNLAAALIKAQQEMEPLVKDAKNPHFNSRYSTLAGVQEVALPALAKYEIAVLQSVGVEWQDSGPLVKVGCTLFHAPSGEFVVNDIPLRPVKADPQGIGSAITYGRRYLLMTMAGLAPEDDDGNAASRQPVQKPVKPQNVSRETFQTVEHRNITSDADIDKVLDEANPFDQNGPEVAPEPEVKALPADLLMAFADGCKKKHQRSPGPCTDKQYKFLAGILDNLTQPGGHNDILAFLCDTDAITQSNPPGIDLVSFLLKHLTEMKDKQPNPEYKAQYVQAVKQIWNEVKETA